MRCPFLREAQVKFCRASAFRKMIVRLPGQPDNERCSSSDYVNCPVVKQHHEERPSLAHCPFLNESLVQYCSGASVTKYVPYSESAISQCGTESHKYCELYLALAQPEPTLTVGPASENPDHREGTAGDILVSGRLWYSPNHMWLDVGADGVLHVGVDAFFARVLGGLDGLTFVTTGGLCHPTVMFSMRGTEFQMVFPNQMVITKQNLYLRTNPTKLLADPYTHGWLFEGLEPKPSQRGESSITNGLISGAAAFEWMHNETQRITRMVHDLNIHPQYTGEILMADGGAAQEGFVNHLSREKILQFFNGFFSPQAHWRKM